MRSISGVTFFLLFFTASFAYSQCLSGDCWDGLGTYVFDSGARYEGHFKNGRLNGQGILTFRNGNKYNGNWVNTYRQGEGTLLFANGNMFKGNFQKSHIQGTGTMKYVNGDYYTGNWIMDKPNGNGAYYFHTGERYEGEFHDGQFEGKGIMYYNDGSIYSGQWKLNKRNGRGQYVYADGTNLNGNWENDNIAKEDVEVNSAEIADEDNSENTFEKLPDCTDGSCGNGTGVYRYQDGSRYVGSFRNGEPDGQGTCFYSNKNRYEGDWKNHAPNGEGILYYSNGTVLHAIWNEGKPDRQISNHSVPVVKDQSVLANSKPESNSKKNTIDESPEVKIWAVVVGVGRYTHMPVLKYPDDDAYQTYAFLKSPEGGALPDEQIKVLIDEDATRVNILDAMHDVFSRADANDVVIFYFSGHGLDGCFLPVDFNGYDNKIMHEEIKQILGESKAKSKLCIADACHSGGLLASRGGTYNIQKLYSAFNESKGGVALFMSSKSEENSLEDQGLRSGVFSHFLLKGLKGAADTNKDKLVTITELYNYVGRSVRNYTGNLQSPTITGDYDVNMPVATVR